MGMLNSLNSLSLSANAIAIASGNGDDIVGMLNLAKQKAADFIKSTSVLSGLITAGSNKNLINFSNADMSTAAVLNFADPYESGLVFLI